MDKFIDTYQLHFFWAAVALAVLTSVLWITLLVMARVSRLREAKREQNRIQWDPNAHLPLNP
jgi:heme exporter protein D